MLFAAEDQWAGGSGRVGAVGVVLLQCQVSRLVDRPPVGAVGHPFAAH
jgi:hypothetical protein